MDVTINPLSKAIGAEILGVDLSEKVDSEDLFHINLAMQKSLVLVFRNQKLEPNNLLSAVRLFGDTMEQHLTDTLMESHPEIAVLDSREMPPDKEGKIIPFGGRDWHTDHTNHELPLNLQFYMLLNSQTPVGIQVLPICTLLLILCLKVKKLN